MEEKDFLESVGSIIERFDDRLKRNTTANQRNGNACQDFLDDFRLRAEREILPVMRQIEEQAQSSKAVSVKIKDDLPEQVSATFTIDSGKKIKDVRLVAYVANCNTRRVDVVTENGVGPGGGSIPPEKITQESVRQHLAQTLTARARFD